MTRDPIEEAIGLLVYWRARSRWASDAAEYVRDMLAQAERDEGPLAILRTEAGATRLAAGGYTLTPRTT